MRFLFVLFVIACALNLHMVAAGGKKQSLTMPAPLATKTLPTQYEQLPEKTQETRYLEDVVQTEYVDIPIVKAKIVNQPIVQQRIVEQPIVRTRVINRPIVRRVRKQRVERPHILEKTEIVPILSEEKIVQPKISEQNIIRENFSKMHGVNPTLNEKATTSQKTHVQAFRNQ